MAEESIVTNYTFLVRCLSLVDEIVYLAIDKNQFKISEIPADNDKYSYSLLEDTALIQELEEAIKNKEFDYDESDSNTNFYYYKDWIIEESVRQISFEKFQIYKEE